MRKYIIILTTLVLLLTISGCINNMPNKTIPNNKTSGSGNKMADFNEYKNKFVDPVVTTGIAFFSWENANEISFEYLDNFFRYTTPRDNIKNYAATPDNIYGYYNIPQELYEKVITDRFDVSLPHLRLHDLFTGNLIASKSYRLQYPKTVYNYIDTACTRIINVDESKDEIKIDFAYYELETNKDYKNVALTITKQGDSYKYKSCKVTDIKENLADLTLNYKEAYNLKYIKPVAVDTAIAYTNWTDANKINPKHFDSFYAFTSYGVPEYNFNQFKNQNSVGYSIPQELLENFVMRYFDVSVGHLRESTFYNASGKIYTGFYSDQGPRTITVVQSITEIGANISIVFASYSQEYEGKKLLGVYEIGIKTNGKDYKYSYAKVISRQ